MLYLNYDFLTSDRIITWFEKNLEQLNTLPDVSKKPSNLDQLKRKLKNAFFEEMGNKSLDKEVLAQLQQDERFASNYPKLKKVLCIILSLNDKSDKKLALQELKEIKQLDWNIEGARTKFDELNANFGYFPHPSEDLYNLFTEMAISCRTMVVLFEKNNTAEDTMAYDYAYKLMALFINPEDSKTLNLSTLATSTFNLLKNINNDKQHPFHEALLVQLNPLPHANTITDREGWRKLIKKHGVRAFPFFLMAEQIEKKIAAQPNGKRRAPQNNDNLQEANQMLTLCSYNCAEEDPEFARLSWHHQASEAMFNASLNYLNESPGWPKKEGDNLPNLTIQGESEANGLYWVKLPVTDKRALILGQITDCCQSIGGHSEQCVKDAVSLQDNALYVLLKQKKKGIGKLIESGQINEKDFKIIGQSYVWMSILGNVCLDSLECLKDEVTNEALHAIITKFGKTVLEQYPSVCYVNIGSGGKTPENLFKETEIPELMRQGTQYADSYEQYCILESPINLSQKHQKTLEHIFKGYSKDSLNYLKRYAEKNDSNRLVPKLKTLFDTNKKGQTNQEGLTANNNPEGLIIAVLVMHQTGLLDRANAQANFNTMLKHQNPRWAAEALATLNQADLLLGEQGQANVDTVLKHQDPQGVARALETLNQAGFLSEEQGKANIDTVLKHQDPQGVARALETLNQAGLLSEEQGKANIDTVLKHQDPYTAAEALATLNQADLLSGEQGQANIDTVLKHQNPHGAARALDTLNQAGLLSEELGKANVDAVFKHQNPHGVARALDTLNQAGLVSGEQGQANVDALLKHQDPYSAARALATLSETRLLSGEQGQANVNALLKHQTPYAAARALETLNQAGLLSEEQGQANVDALLKHQDPRSAARALATMSKTRLLSGEQGQANVDTVIKHQNPQGVARALDTLNQAGLLSGEQGQANVDTVLKHQDPYTAARALDTLNQAGLLSEELGKANVDAVFKHQNPHGVARALETLNQAGLLSEELGKANVDTVLKHQDPRSAARALETLNQAGLVSEELGQANVDAVLKHNALYTAARALETLNQAGLLSEEQGQANVNALLKHNDPSKLSSVAEALMTLSITGLLLGEQGQANVDALLKHQDPYSAARALATMNKTRLLSREQGQANVDAVINHLDPHSTAETLQTLSVADLLSGEQGQANVDAVLKQLDPSNLSSVANALINLCITGLLSGEQGQANVNTVLKHQNPRNTTEALATLNQAGLLSGEQRQANVDAVLKHQDPRSAARALATMSEARLLSGEKAQVKFNIAYFIMDIFRTTELEKLLLEQNAPYDDILVESIKEVIYNINPNQTPLSHTNQIHSKILSYFKELSQDKDFKISHIIQASQHPKLDRLLYPAIEDQPKKFTTFKDKFMAIIFKNKSVTTKDKEQANADESKKNDSNKP